MAKDFAKSFYKSKAWQQCRDSYAASVGGLCQECLKNGLITAGEIVHHRVHLSPETIHDPQVLLSWENLELVCRSCHGKLHGDQRRYTVDPAGHIVPR